MIPTFGFAVPTQILFGRGEFAKAPELSASMGKRCFVVHGATLRHAGAFLTKIQTEADTFACAKEPDLDLLNKALQAARDCRASHVVAIGGGAAIDLGKAVAALLRSGTEPLDHLEVIGKGLALDARPAPFMAIPTTSGTGAEATKNAVIGAPEHQRKVSLRDPRMIADIALVDPALTDATPKPVTLACGMDAVTQVIEPYLSCRATPLTDTLCRDAIPRGLRALARLMQEEDQSARDDLALTSLCGGLALANSGLGAVHGLASVLGGHLPHAPHGAICGALLSPVLAANFATCDRDSPQALRIAETRVSIASAVGTVDISGWARVHGLPTLRAMGLKEEALDVVANAAQSASSMKANPVPLNTATLINILKSAL